MIRLNTFKYFFFGLFLLFFSASSFSENKTSFLKPDSPLPFAVFIYMEKDTLQNFKKRLSVYRTEKFKDEWSKRFSPIETPWKDFLAEYEKIPLQVKTAQVSVYFFSKEGVYLIHELFLPSLPDWKILTTVGKLENELEEYKKTGKTTRSLLFWPLRAYQSEKYKLAKLWLKNVDYQKLKTEEKKAFEKLQELIAGVN